MSEHAEISGGPTTPPIACSAAARRMRAHRQRRRDGLRCIVVQLRETEIDELIRMGLLQADARKSGKTPPGTVEVVQGNSDGFYHFTIGARVMAKIISRLSEPSDPMYNEGPQRYSPHWARTFRGSKKPLPPSTAG